MIITIRQANASGAYAYSFRPWHSYELLDSGGASLTGGMPITAGYQKTIVDGQRQNSGAIDLLSPESHPIIVEFGSARADFLHGSLTGYITFSGMERLVLVTDAALTAGSYEVRIEYLAAARVNVNGGRISVLPS